MTVSSYISPKARKGQLSAIQGRGLAAVAPISQDEIVAIKGGHIVGTATLRSLPERLQNSGDYFSTYLLRRIKQADGPR